jgi:hypothetical protein
MASEESTGSFAISFSKFGIDDAVGHWNKGGVDSYPADIRIWNSDATSLDEAAPFAGIHLESVDKGKAFVTFKDADQTTLGLRIDFENVGDTASCSKSPSSTNCHTQSVQMHANPVQSTDALPAGFNVMVMADSKSAPTFYAVEGKLRYTEDQAGVLFADLGLTTLRTIYFQVIQKSSEVYGKFEFRDADGERLSLAFGDIDLMELLSEGICADITSADSDLQECAKITAADYETLWTGEEAMESITTSPFTIDMETGRPDEAGFVIAD